MTVPINLVDSVLFGCCFLIIPKRTLECVILQERGDSMSLDYNNPFLQQKITKQADEQFKNIYSDDFSRRLEGSKIITEVLKNTDKNDQCNPFKVN